MPYSLKFSTTKVAAAFVGLAIVMAVFFGATVAPAHGQSIADLQAQITALMAQLNAMQGGSSTSTGFVFAKNLKMGMTDSDVKQLQMVLNKSADTMVSSSGAGSPGAESTYFGAKTLAAVKKYQTKMGISPVSGYVGPLTRASLNASMPTTPTTGTPTTPTPTTGKNLTVSNTTQPAASLAPESAARIPFTKVMLTAGTDGDVTVNSLTVERTGLAADAAFSGVVLLDENGIQIGISKTLNSNHQVTVGEAFVVKAGTTRTLTVAGNMASDNDTRAGQVAQLSVVGVNSSATVSGSLPIAGAAHTINASLALGSVTVAISSFDPNTSATKEIGTTAYKFSGIRVTAGSAEKVKVHSIRWNQTGSVGSGDLANVKTYVDGVAYDTVVSADGKYYTSSFGSGISIDKGLAKDIYIQGDIVGSGSSGRTVIFDVDKTTDLYLSGETYGYGITPPAGSGTASDDTSEFTAGTPWFDGSKVTVSAGSATSIGKANSVAAQNIAVNVPNQVLGGYETDFKGEAVSVSSTVVNFNLSSEDATTRLLTNVSIVDENGSVVAGPVDATDVGGTEMKATFTDTITYPVGKKVYTIKGKVDSDVSNGQTIVASTTPSSWSTVRGQTTGNTITLSQANFTMNTMTVKAAALAVGVSATPVAQNIVAGVQGFTFANYQLDATQSGEDVRFSSIPLALDRGNNATAGAASKLTSCQLFDGTTALNTGSNAVNPTDTATTTSPTAHTFTFDQSLTIPKGTVKTLALKCNLLSSADTNSQFQWGLIAAPSITVTGVTSSNDVTETVTASDGQIMTASSGSLVISTDSSSPSLKVAAAGTTGNIAGVYKFRAANESVTLEKLGLKLTNTASSSASDLILVSVWDGATKVGEATFVGATTVATSTFTTNVLLPKDADKTLTVKVDLAPIGTSLPGTQGHLIAVDYAANSAVVGTGASSGTSITPTGTTAVNGIRMFKSYPTFAKLAIPSSSLVSGSDADLYRFSITANSAGPVGIYKFTVNIATSSTPNGTSSTTVTSLKVKAYTDSGFSSEVSGFDPSGQLNDTITGLVSSGNTDVTMTASSQGQDYLQIPAGATYYFRVVGSITMTGSPTGAQVVTNIQGDAAFPVTVYSALGGTGFMASTTAIDADTNDDFIWSPNATTTTPTTGDDWTNGYQIPGLPSDNMDNVTLSK